MNISELLSFKPDQTPKRSLDASIDDPPAKRASSNVTAGDQSLPTSAEDILRLVEQEPEVEPVDAVLVKRLLLNLEKRSLNNQQLRTKHAGQPRRFLDSELQLHDALQQLQLLATAPPLYGHLLRLGALNTLVTLLAHDNCDIVIAVIGLLQELLDTETDDDAEADRPSDAESDADSDDDDELARQERAALAARPLSQRCAARLASSWVRIDGVAAVVAAMERLDETRADEAAGVHNALAVLEQAVELCPRHCRAAADQGLLAWLLRRLQQRQFDANKLYASEMLSVLVQSDEHNKSLLGDLDGVDVLLRQLAYYKRRDPAAADETEYVHNMFDTLCSVLLLSANKERFLRGEGLQLMNLMLREKKQSRAGALKVLNYATAGGAAVAADNCVKLVDILALRTIFPLFMHTPSRGKRKGMSAEEHEEHVVSIVAALLRHCRGSQVRARVINKFIEANCEKIDRLMELHFKYLDKVQHTDVELERRASSDGELPPPLAYMRRLDGGLFVLQLVDLVIVDLCASSGHAPIKQRVTQTLAMHNASVKTIRYIVREYAGNLGESESASAGSESQTSNGDDVSTQLVVEQQRILQLVDKF